MATNKTLSEQIVDASRSGYDPAVIDKLESVTGDLIAAGTQVANITDATTAHALSATFTDTEVEAALNALGTKINSIIAALEAFGIAASS